MEKVNLNYLNCTFDAQIWTKEWLKTIKENPSIPTDEGTMISWFACAIMAGYDHARREMCLDSPDQIVSNDKEMSNE